MTRTQILALPPNKRASCPTCDGTGEVHSHNPRCWSCHGIGEVSIGDAAAIKRAKLS